MNSRILSIAALDSSGGAGLNQDIRVAALLGHRIHSCPSGFSIQSSRGVEDIHPFDNKTFELYLTKTLADAQPRFIKIGALCSASQIPILCKTLKAYNNAEILVDPVFSPSKGKSFIKEAELYLPLLEIATYLSPNLPEIARLSKQLIDSHQTALEAAKQLAKKFEIDILLKGGHLKLDPIPESYVTPNDVQTHYMPKRLWAYRHGTGCALGMAFICHLAQGFRAPEAFFKASAWVMNFFDSLNSESS